jgi:hypothetical protein
MDATSILVVVTFVGSMLIVGELAHELGRSQSRWAWTAAVVGPLAIPMLCLVAATSAFRKMMNARRR